MIMASAEVTVPEEMSLKPLSKLEVVKDDSSIVMDFTLQNVQSVTVCTAIDLAKNETWKMNAIVGRSDATVPTLANTRLTWPISPRVQPKVVVKSVCSPDGRLTLCIWPDSPVPGAHVTGAKRATYTRSVDRKGDGL
ncbi:hypothetical protein COCVIDRAFT_21357 [Bipolaris victoriae FI3]|uniref:Uncharacterized protein n=1 Tax=Bipolaris victoriae (strain FI3) TaxID=930091 RepID=W7E8X7_BIPV3|nr:hypothetical protein COCVIDRAFT_21357 [Bipolaris victoriae FI3]